MRARSLSFVLFVPVLLVSLVACEDKPSATTTASASAPASASATAAASASASASATATASAAASAAEVKPPPESIACQHVLIAYKGAKNAPAGVTRSKADAKTRAEDIHSKAVAGMDFTKLAQDFSDDPGSRERLGSVGKFKRDGMVKPFSDAAFALPVDGISDVVETPFGFHVIKRNQ